MTETQRGKIDQMLQDNASLLEILSEKDVVSQSRWETQRGFSDYFDRDKTKQMLGHIVFAAQVQGEDSAEVHRLGHVVPFVASEIFNAEIPTVTKEFFYRSIAAVVHQQQQEATTEDTTTSDTATVEDAVEQDKSQSQADDSKDVVQIQTAESSEEPKSEESVDVPSEQDNELLFLLLTVLGNDSDDVSCEQEVNSVLAGYFEKIFQILVGAYPKETFIALFTQTEGQQALLQMVKHADTNYSIASVLEKCLNFSESCIPSSLLQTALDFREQLVQKLVQNVLGHNSQALVVLKGLSQEVLEILLHDSVVEMLESSDSLKVFELLKVMIHKLSGFHAGKQKLQLIIQAQIDALKGDKFDTIKSMERLQAVEMILAALKCEITIDLKAMAGQLVDSFGKYPLQDSLLQKIAQVLIGYLSSDEENEATLLHLLFSTDFVKQIVSGENQTHLHQLGFRLSELSEESEQVKEFLDELVDGWPDYLERLAKYIKTREGTLLEDPRDSKNDQFSSLLRLKLTDEGDEEGDEEELQQFSFKVKDDGDFGMPVMQADEPTSQDDFDRLMLPQLEFGQDGLEECSSPKNSHDDMAMMFYSSNGRQGTKQALADDGEDQDDGDGSDSPLKFQQLSCGSEEEDEGPTPSPNEGAEMASLTKEDPQFYGSVYWKLEVELDQSELEGLLQDYDL